MWSGTLSCARCVPEGRRPLPGGSGGGRAVARSPRAVISRRPIGRTRSRHLLRDRITHDGILVSWNSSTCGRTELHGALRYSYVHCYVRSPVDVSRRRSRSTDQSATPRRVSRHGGEFGGGLQSRTLSAQGSSIRELLRTLETMAASKPTFGWSSDPHLLCHTESSLRDLIRPSGLFPSRRRPLAANDCLGKVCGSLAGPLSHPHSEFNKRR